MVCAKGWLSTLGVKELSGAVVVKCDVKPSRKSGAPYRTLVAVKRNGAVVNGHCTCMAGLSEVCSHVGAILYKCMQEAPRNQPEVSCTSLPCQWLPARKNVRPAEAAPHNPCLQVDNLLVKVILPEVIGHLYTKPRILSLGDVINMVEVVQGSSSPCEVYCFCKGPDDGSKMMCCENKNCKAGQWFHLKCLHMKKVP